MTSELRAIGWVESPLTDVADAPLQGNEGAPDAWIVVEPDVLAVEGARVHVRPLEALHGTPVLDLEPVLA